MTSVLAPVAGSFDEATYQARRRAASRARGRDAGLGVALLAAVALVVGLIVASFSGRFTNFVSLKATIPAGEPATVGNEVEYDQVQVGTVAAIGAPTPGGGSVVELHLDPSKLASVPANVVAQVLPSSLFGSTAVVLTSLAPSTGTHLTARTAIPAAGAGGGSLQGTLVDLNKLLTGLHPAQIDTTLGALTDAFQGQGPALHDFVGQLDTYVAQMLPQLPTLESDIALLTPVLEGFSASVPDLLTLAGNASVTANTITSQSAELLGLLRGGEGTAVLATDLLARIQESLHGFAANLTPLLGLIAADPSKLPQILSAATKWAAGWSSAETDGPWINVTTPYSAQDFVPFAISGLNLFPPGENQALTQQGNADRLAVPPNAALPYTAAQCPRYGPEHGPNCVSGSSPNAGASAGGGGALQPQGGPISNPAQDAAASEMAAALSGGDPQVGAALLGPLLRSIMP